jgi:UDP-N-acetyl-D-mannosaminuronic acid dehydrogenase
MKVVTIGLGYIGLPTSALIASKSIPVHGVDINENVVETINQGKIHIVEPDLDNVVQFAVEQGFLKASTIPVEGDVYLIVVPTPFKGNHEPDISYVEAATRSVLQLLKPDDLYIIESTSPIGTTELMARLIFEERPELINKIHIAYCPERVLPGNVMHELVNNDRIIGGINEASSHAAIAFYSKIVKGELHMTNARTAEMCKLVENASRDNQIAFANELSIICSKAKIDVWELIHLTNKHPRVNVLQPGCGVGGHCIAVDPYFISSAFPKESVLIQTAREVNINKTKWCIGEIDKAIIDFYRAENRLPKVALCGLSFKPNIDDLRESPAVEIARAIAQTHPRDLLFFIEPNIETHAEFEISKWENIKEEIDISFILVSHREFEKIVFKKKISFVGN